MLRRKNSSVSELKRGLPLLQTVAFRDFHDDPNKFFSIPPSSKKSFEFLKNVNRLLLEEPVFKRCFCAMMVSTFGTPELFPDNEDERYEGQST